MKFESSLVRGTLLRRYKRFLADVELEDGSIVTAHSANTGSMKGCCTPGSAVWLSRSDNPKRKCPYTWELVQAGNTIVGINTALPNLLVAEAIAAGRIPELNGFAELRREVAYGEERSRIDILLTHPARPACYVEVKNVTLAEMSVARFPDAVSTRGTKHLRELMTVVRAGDRAVIFFCVQRGDVDEVQPADEIDWLYGQTLREAVAAGVEAMAWRAKPTPAGIELLQPLPVVLPPAQRNPDCGKNKIRPTRAG